MARTAALRSPRPPVPPTEEGNDPLARLLRLIARLPAVIATPLALALAPLIIAVVLIGGFFVGLRFEPANTLFGYSVSAAVVWVFLAYVGLV
jgi:hypothetical protein